MDEKNINTIEKKRKVLSYHPFSNGEHWFKYEDYKQKHIDSIQDPEGGIGEMPSSIPSPFAQMDLVKTAFKNIISQARKIEKQGNDPEQIRNLLSGNSNDHKLISNCFDVGELFFNHEKVKKLIKVIPWDKKNDIDRLRSSGNIKHRRLADALELYLEQDAASFNFDKLNRLFFLEYDNDPDNIIGGTSPVTLFFASPNPLDKIDIKLTHQENFFKVSVPLYKRSEEFQLFLYTFEKSIPNFSELFKVISDYLEINKKILKPEFSRKINSLANDFYYSNRGYDSFILKSGIQLEVLGFPLRKEAVGGIDDLISDFKINSHKPVKDNLVPLILNKDFGGTTSRGNKLMYFNNMEFSADLRSSIPYFVGDSDLLGRELPGGVGVKYPYLVIGDLLEDYLIRLKYPLNDSAFYSFTPKKDSVGYLIPIKKKYFEYFNPDFLKDQISGKPVFEMKEVGAKGIEVCLRIPLRIGECVEIKKVYYNSGVSTPDPEKNKGALIDCSIDLTVFPFIKFTKSDADYRIQFIDRDVRNSLLKKDYFLNFYNSASNQPSPITLQKPRKRSSKERDNTSTQYYIIQNTNFDFIELRNQDVSGIIIPNFTEEKGGNIEFTFSVDFGTTNTHIEYSTTTDKEARPFTINVEESMVLTLHHPDYEIDESKHDPLLLRYISQEFLPKSVGKDSEYSFPCRTVIGENADLDFTVTPFALADMNIPLTYEKKPMFMNMNIVPNLKWSDYVFASKDSENYKKRIEAFFEEIMLLIRAKVIVNNGDLSKVKFIWFYPSSMMSGRLEKLEQAWSKCYKRYIHDSSKNQDTNAKNENDNLEKIIKISESLAPFYYYKEKYKVSASEKPVVSIDIGGGTTDVVVFTGETPNLLTSFKFAANSVFGDGYANFPAADNNALCLKYYEIIKDKLSKSDQEELTGVFEKVNNSKISEEIISFYFSLANNEKLRKKNIAINFNEWLSDDKELKFIFVLFYVAIIYHVANLMKSKGLQMPRYLTLSGTGSKIVYIISPKTNTLAELTRTIFEKVYLQKYDADGFEIKMHSYPKEITCKGGIMSTLKVHNIEVEKLKQVYAGTKSYDFINKLPYKDIENNDTIVQETAASVKEFLEFVKTELNDCFNFVNRLDMAPQLDYYIKELNRDILQNIRDGISKKILELGDAKNSQTVEETFFFYHFIGALNSLALNIYKGMNK